MIKKVTITVEQEALRDPLDARHVVSGTEATNDNNVLITYIVSYNGKVWSDGEDCSYDGAQAVWDTLLAKACKIAVEETNGTRE